MIKHGREIGKEGTKERKGEVKRREAGLEMAACNDGLMSIPGPRRDPLLAGVEWGVVEGGVCSFGWAYT